MEIKVKAPAKINLTLDIVGRRPDGYHNIETVMQTVDLYDTVTVSDNDSGSITISCDYEGVPCDESNICFKAAKKFFDYTETENKGIHIDIEKKIPTQAGLGGGSADGAAVIMGLNFMLNTMLKEKEMCEIAEKVGADVPFCIKGGTRFCFGTGTEMKKVPSFHCERIVICKPDSIGVSTQEAYKKADMLNPHPSYTREMINSLYSYDIFRIATSIYNDFEVALNIPEIVKLKRKMLENKAKGTGMSGSGSAVFGIFSSEKKAKKCFLNLNNEYKEVFLCKPIKGGCSVER